MIGVLHLIQTLNLGGAERNLYNLVRAMDSSVVESHVGYCYGGEFEPLFLKDGIRLFKYSNKLHKLVSVDMLFAVSRAVGYVKRHKIRVIQTHNFNAHLLGLIVAKLTGAKLIEHVHDFRYIEKERREEGQSFVKQFDFIYKLKGRSDRVVVLTQQNADFLLKNKLYAPDRIRIIRNGIPMNDSVPSGKGFGERFGIQEGRPIILTPSRMSPVKNIELILRIAPAVCSQVPNAIFIVAGDGKMLEEYRRRASDLNLADCLRFIGFYPDTRELLAIADLLLLPSFLELHSIAILEALSMKVPVVASQGVGCNSDIFHPGEDGVLLDPFSMTGWVDAIVGLLKNPARRRLIGERGYALCRSQFDIRNVAKRFEELYAELIKL